VWRRGFLRAIIHLLGDWEKESRGAAWPGFMGCGGLRVEKDRIGFPLFLSYKTVSFISFIFLSLNLKIGREFVNKNLEVSASFQTKQLSKLQRFWYKK
jgi:hypothetical protein